MSRVKSKHKRKSSKYRNDDDGQIYDDEVERKVVMPEPIRRSESFIVRSTEKDEEAQGVHTYHQGPKIETVPVPTHVQWHAADSIGVSISGGGIRSAAFGLGCLLAMEKKGFNRKI